MEILNVLGVDAGKDTLDVHLYQQKQGVGDVPNSEKGFRQLIKWLRQYYPRGYKGLIVVMEFTGHYTLSFERFLHQKKIAFVKRPGLDIKRSRGMERGKSDKADARFIARYGWMRKEELVPMTPVPDSILQLQQLISFREKLVLDRTSYKIRMAVLKGEMDLYLNTELKSSTETLLRQFQTKIKHTETAIHLHLKRNPELLRTYQLLTSVVGVGLSTAVHFIVYTGNFTRFATARKLCCYCGIAPFPHESGTSIYRKPRLSFMANKKLKVLLTICATSALIVDPELYEKYQAKRKEGKPHFVALNIIRAKLIYRMWAVMKRGTKYELAGKLERQAKMAILRKADELDAKGKTVKKKAAKKKAVKKKAVKRLK